MPIEWRVKAVVHRRGDADGGVNPIEPRAGRCGLAEQVLQFVGKAFGLKNLSGLDLATTAQDAVAGAGQDMGAHVHRPGPVFELADEKVMQAGEFLLARFAEVNVGEQAPYMNRYPAHPGVLDLAEPSHEMGHSQPGDSVGQ